MPPRWLQACNPFPFPPPPIRPSGLAIRSGGGGWGEAGIPAFFPVPAGLQKWLGKRM